MLIAIRHDRAAAGRRRVQRGLDEFAGQAAQMEVALPGWEQPVASALLGVAENMRRISSSTGEPDLTRWQ